MKIEYEVLSFTDDMIIVCRKETKDIPIKGLPPTNSQCIIMQSEELESFVEKRSEEHTSELQSH